MKWLQRLLRRKPTYDEAFHGLEAAVRSSDTVRIRELLTLYPELIERSGERGMRPLHWAAEAQSLSSIACLVDLGADTRAKDQMGYTAEDIAHWNGEFRMGAYTDVCLKIVERLRKIPAQEKA